MDQLTAYVVLSWFLLLVGAGPEFLPDRVSLFLWGLLLPLLLWMVVPLNDVKGTLQLEKVLLLLLFVQQLAVRHEPVGVTLLDRGTPYRDILGLRIRLLMAVRLLLRLLPPCEEPPPLYPQSGVLLLQLLLVSGVVLLPLLGLHSYLHV